MTRLLAFLGFAFLVASVRDIPDEDIHKYTFEDYIADWGKSYPSHLDYSIHKQMFETRKAAILQQNSDPHATWKAGFNKFTDMTEAEFKAYRGFNTRLAALSDAPRVSVPPPQAGAPASVDWRSVPGVLTPVKDQGQCGSCWAFATTESIESAYALVTNTTAPVLSPQNVVSCTPNPDHCGGTGGCNGATAELGITYVASAGIYYDKDWPYTATTGLCRPPAGSPVVTVSGYVKLGENSYSDLLNAVVQQPISVSVDASTWSIYRSGIFNCTGASLDIDHAVNLVGYGSENGQDYWIVRNSWGTSWGEKGYIRLVRHSDGSSKWCWPDATPQDGSGCDGGPSSITVCGTCGIWYDNCYPTGARAWTP